MGSLGIFAPLHCFVVALYVQHVRWYFHCTGSESISQRLCWEWPKAGVQQPSPRKCQTFQVSPEIASINYHPFYRWFVFWLIMLIRLHIQYTDCSIFDVVNNLITINHDYQLVPRFTILNHYWIVSTIYWNILKPLSSTNYQNYSRQNN